MCYKFSTSQFSVHINTNKTTRIRILQQRDCPIRYNHSVLTYFSIELIAIVPFEREAVASAQN